MKRILALSALCVAFGVSAQSAPAPLPTSPAKKELVKKVLALQQPEVEMLARNLAQEPAARMMQEAGRVLQNQVAEDKREAAVKSLEESAEKGSLRETRNHAKDRESTHTRGTRRHTRAFTGGPGGRGTGRCAQCVACVALLGRPLRWGPRLGRGAGGEEGGSPC